MAHSEIVYDGNLESNKVEVWRNDKYFQIRFVIRDPVFGDIHFRSDLFSGLCEADSRAFVASRILGLDRDNLPVHRCKS